MKGRFRVFAGVGLPLIVAVFAFAEVNDFNGRWTATATRGNKTAIVVIELNVNAEHVTGTLHDPSGQILQIQNGKVERQHLTFDASAQEHRRSKIIHFDAEMAGDAITLRNESNGRQGLTMIFHRSAE